MPYLCYLFNRDYWFISIGAFFRYGTYVAIQGLWAGPYLMQGLGFSSVKAGNLLLTLNMAFTCINLFTMLGAATLLQGMGWILENWRVVAVPGPEEYQAAFFTGFLGMAVAVGFYFVTREDLRTSLSSSPVDKG